MAEGRDWEQMDLINELNQGRELANELKNHIDPTTISPETCELLLQKILSCYDKALSMVQLNGSVGEPQLMPGGMLESLRSVAGGSPRSEESDHDYKDQPYKDVFKKRKTLPRWSKQVRVFSGTALEGPLDDGHSWRKYGQKDILGANFPRAYYRCTHRYTRGCLAAKQVQRSSEDPSIIEITYRGRHTCIQTPQSTPPPALIPVQKEGPRQNKNHSSQRHEEPNQAQPQEKLSDCGKGIGIVAEDLSNGEEIFQSISFPSTPIESEIVESHFFSDPLQEDNFLGGSSPSFISPATSDSNYFLPISQMNCFGMENNLQSSESDPTEIVSSPTLVTNSPAGDLDFPLDQLNFDSNFPFDILEFFS